MLYTPDDRHPESYRHFLNRLAPKYVSQISALRSRRQFVGTKKAFFSTASNGALQQAPTLALMCLTANCASQGRVQCASFNIEEAVPLRSADGARRRERRRGHHTVSPAVEPTSSGQSQRFECAKTPEQSELLRNGSPDL